MKKVKNAPDQKEDGDTKADDEHKKPIRNRWWCDREIGEDGEILEGVVFVGDGFTLSTGKDNREDRFADEQEDSIESPGKNSANNSPDQARAVRPDIVEKTLEYTGAGFGEVIRRSLGEIKRAGRCFRFNRLGHDV